MKTRFLTANKIYIHVFGFIFCNCKSSISMAEVDHDIFGDSNSDQSFDGFTAEELNESIPREDISVEEYSSESENEGNSEEQTVIV